MRVDQLMSTEVHWCGPQDTLATAARAMWDADCGALPVCDQDDGRPLVGMITDRDICMAALFEAAPLEELIVETAMSAKIRACRAHETPREVEQMMRTVRVRRIPVVDESANLVGIVSLADLARGPSELQAGPHEPAETDVVETLAAICEPDPNQPAA